MTITRKLKKAEKFLVGMFKDDPEYRIGDCSTHGIYATKVLSPEAGCPTCNRIKRVSVLERIEKQKRLEVKYLEIDTILG